LPTNGKTPWVDGFNAQYLQKRIGKTPPAKSEPSDDSVVENINTGA
jgi:hypothetical protein